MNDNDVAVKSDRAALVHHRAEDQLLTRDNGEQMACYFADDCNR